MRAAARSMTVGQLRAHLAGEPDEKRVTIILAHKIEGGWIVDEEGPRGGNVRRPLANEAMTGATLDLFALTNREIVSRRRRKKRSKPRGNE